ncbi:MAG: hypothetical protein J3K34DRAFT_442413 [Monoraphidium minutum]|nr:MAG: hypothetical protein J3K34DRAFT_442413 [Monoraphidium minutum]
MAAAAAADGSGAGPSSPGGAAQLLARGAPRPSGSGLSPDAAAAVRRALRELFRLHPVVNLQDIRGHLAGYNNPGSTARQGAALGDDALHEVVVGGGEFAALQRAYATRPAPKDPAGELRAVILDLLAERSTVRKSDIMAAAKAANASFAESHYGKIMRELCRNAAGVWTTKTGIGG